MEVTGCHKLKGVTLSGLSLLAQLSRQRVRANAVPAATVLLTDPATGTPAQLRSFAGPVSAYTVTTEMHFCHAQWSAGVPYFCGSVSGVQALCGHHSHPLPWVLESGPPGAPFLRGPGGAPSPAPGSLLSPPPPPGLPDNLLCLDFYRKKLFAGNFSFGPISVSCRGKRANAWFPPWTWEPEIPNKTLLTSI